MKILFLVFGLFSFVFGLDGFLEDYGEALKKAKQEHKKVYMLITSDSCRWCRKFEQTTLKDKTFLDKLKKNYVLLHLSRDRDFIPKKFDTAPVPRHYFLSADGKTIFASLGHRNVTMFNSFLKTVDEIQNKGKK